MASKPLTRTFKKKEVAVETASSIEAQTQAFLAAGGEIQELKSGVSGQPSIAPAKPFTITKKPKE